MHAERRFCYGTLEVDCIDAPGFLLLQCRGEASLSYFLAAIDEAAAEARRTAATRVLFDVRAVQQFLSYSEHLQLGAALADKLRFMQRVASVVPIEKRSGASEKAAQRNNLNLRAFTDLTQAMQWVQEDQHAV